MSATAQISVFFILPETKGVSLERMEKIFGNVDFVEAGECEGGVEKVEARTMSEDDDKAAGRTHVEDVPQPQATTTDTRLPV